MLSKCNNSDKNNTSDIVKEQDNDKDLDIAEPYHILKFTPGLANLSIGCQTERVMHNTFDD